MTARRVAALAFVLGTALRIEQFLSRPSLWLDEAMLANNLVERGFGRLLDPLDSGQGAPALFLWFERAAILALGNNEYALRLLPLLAGIATLALVWLIGRRLGGERVGAAALALAALSPPLIRYSNEVKQYGPDAAVALLLVWLTLRALDQRPGALAWLTGAGVVALWASHPAVFVLAAAGLVLLLQRRRPLPRLLAVGGTWLASFGLAYLVTLGDLAGDDFFHSEWVRLEGFAPRPLKFGSTLRWFGDAVVDLVSFPGGFEVPLLVLGVAVAGSVLLARREWLHAALLGLPVVVLVGAAVLERFPFRSRVVLFALPLLLLLPLASTLLIGRWQLAAAVVAVLALPPTIDTVEVAADPLEIAGTRQVLEQVEARWRAGDELWVHWPATAPYQYYAPRLGLRATTQVQWFGTDTCTPADRLRVPGVGRLWLVQAYTFEAWPDDADERLRALFDTRARRLDVIEGNDASATLYDLGALPTDVDGSELRLTDDLACLKTTALPGPRAPSLSSGPFGTGDPS